MFNSISIIICTHNGKTRLEKTLPHVFNQDINPHSCSIEVLIIDNNSDEPIESWIYDFCNDINKSCVIRVIKEDKPGKANAVITGYDSAMGEILLMLDDDNWIPKHYIRTVIEIFNSNPQIGVLGSYGKPWFGSEIQPQWFKDFRRTFACYNFSGQVKEDRDRELRWAAGASIRKKIWDYLKINQFDFFNSKITGKPFGEDVELFDTIIMTGHLQFVDERLWFTHDLTGGRVTTENLSPLHEHAGKTYIASQIIRSIESDLIANKKPKFEEFFNLMIDRYETKNLNAISLYGIWRILIGKRKIATAQSKFYAQIFRKSLVKDLSERKLIYEAYFNSVLSLSDKIFRKFPLSE